MINWQVCPSFKEFPSNDHILRRGKVYKARTIVVAKHMETMDTYILPIKLLSAHLRIKVSYNKFYIVLRVVVVDSLTLLATRKPVPSSCCFLWQL